MGFIFGKKKNQPETQNLETAKYKEEIPAQDSFVCGVYDTFKIMNSEDLVVLCRVRGTVRLGSAVYVSNLGDDEGGVLLTQVLGIEIDSKPVREASNCLAVLILQCGQKFPIKKGTVIYTRDQSTKNVHDVYINAIGDVFVSKQQMVFSDKDLDSMSITDCAEAWRLFGWLCSQNAGNETAEIRAENGKKLDRLASALCKKILSAREIYCVFNKKTGEPHLFSKTLKREDGNYVCTPPDIMLISKAYAKQYAAIYETERFELRKIENGEDGKGIINFLGSAFYQNGACGAAIISDKTAIAAQMLVTPPDYSNTPEINIPVTNPDLVRWLLLIGQLGKPNTEDEKLIYSLYYRFMSIEMQKAKFLVPIKTDGSVPAADNNGITTLTKDMQMAFPIMRGKSDRNAVRMYTDWKRLRMEYGEEWKGLVQTISGMIDIYDCAINLTKFLSAGCYISKEMFEDMKDKASKN